MTLQRQLPALLLLVLTIAIGGCLTSDDPANGQEDTAGAPGPNGGGNGGNGGNNGGEDDDSGDPGDAGDPSDDNGGSGGNGDDPAPPPDDDDDNGGDAVPGDDDDGAPGDDDDGAPGDDGNAGAPPDDGGTALKGPFAQGSEVTAVALAADGSPTGTPIHGVTDARGNFRFSDVPWSGPSMVTVTGQYFDETTGNMSAGTLSLRSALEAEDGVLRGSVNLFTHILARYIDYWMPDGWEYDDLKYYWGIPYLGDFLGFTVAPEELTFMAALDPEINRDSTLLLLYSVGFISAGLDQAAIDRIAQDFAESDGWLTGSGVADFEQWLAAIEEAPEDIVEQAIQQLRAQYGADVPAAFPGFIQSGQTCYFRDPPGICLGWDPRAAWTDDVTLVPGEDRIYSFIPPLPGSYAFSIRPGTNVNWRMGFSPGSSTIASNPPLDSGGRQAAVRRLRAGREVFLTAQGFGENQDVRISAYRLSEGMVSEPSLIPLNERYESVVGRSSGAVDNRHSYFMVRSARAGTYTVRVFADVCGSTAPDVTVRIRGWRGDPWNIDDDSGNPWQGLDGTTLASSDPENFGDCAGQVFEVINGTPHEPPYPYIYIQVQNNAPTRPEIPTFTGRNFVEIEVTPPAGGSVVN